MENKLSRAQFFQKTFLVTNTTLEGILEMPFFTLSNINIQFIKEEFTLRSYTIKKVLLTTSRVELIDKKKFAKTILDNIKVFIVHVFSFRPKSIYPNKKAQIAFLLTKKVIIPDKYLDFANIFLKQQALVLPE